MAKQRSKIAMTEEEQRQFLEDGWTLQVASVGKDGWPHLVAMWYVVIDGKIHFHTYPKSQKFLNLQRNPKVTCMLEAGTTYDQLRGLVIQGEAELVAGDVDTTMAVMAEEGKKYQGNPISLGTDERQRAVASRRAIVRIRPLKVYSWDHRKLATSG